MTTKITKTSLLLLVPFIWACNPAAEPQEPTIETPSEAPVMEEGSDWAKNANIYEVNIRQYTPEGTFNAFAEHLPRLQKMGVDILWFMPIYPISEKRRKGALGSYYAISDYTAINPNFGTMEEFQAVVDQAHSKGMKVLLDWVPNHTGWDHRWIEENKEWYTLDENGEIIDAPEGTDWTDVADLNYDNQDMRKAMIADMKFWLTDVNVDGFRCDVAGNVPLDFWEQAIPQLREAEPNLFMLAEAEVPEHRNTDGLFDMSYGWSFHNLLNEIAEGKKGADHIQAWYDNDRARFNKGYHMQFITNHDENSWNGTIYERMGEAADAMAIMAFIYDGMPLIYSGQEAAMDKRLEFFTKDSIAWGNFEKEAFYAQLLELKHKNEALWNGAFGGEPVRLSTDNQNVFAFKREKNGESVIVVVNLSGQNQSAKVNTTNLSGEYANIFGNSTVTVSEDMETTLNPWGYVVLSKA